MNDFIKSINIKSINKRIRKKFCKIQNKQQISHKQVTPYVMDPRSPMKARSPVCTISPVIPSDNQYLNHL